MKRALHDALKARVEALEGFHWGGLFNNQIEREADEDVIRYPSVFLQFERLEWNSGASPSMHVQTGDVDIALHIAFKQLDKDNPDTLDKVDQLFAWLQGWTPDNEVLGAMHRLRERQDIDYDNVEVWVQVYRLQVIDAQAADRGYQVAIVEEFDVRTEAELCVDNNTIQTGTP